MADKFLEKNDFRKQIAQDIVFYQDKYPTMSNINKPEWAFNFWILDHYFNEDEEVIESRIIDYNDLGIDCFVWHEDTLELYLIQNKYYEDDTKVTKKYVFNDFLTRAIGALEKGTYGRSSELQKIYTKYSSEKDFKVHFQLYVTNNNVDSSIRPQLNEYNNTRSPQMDARIFYLKDMQELYFGKKFEYHKKFAYKLVTINKHTVLNIDENYGIDGIIPARYVFCPVYVLYDLYRKADKDGYPLFEANIREYLGAKKGSVNEGIINTLGSEEKTNFFYYNNGITVICEKMHNMLTEKPTRIPNCDAYFTIDNPQIVNGCQTVSSIFAKLDTIANDDKIKVEYANTFVMVKVLQLDSSSKDLYQKIVRYNNSQNAIKEEAFVANSEIFFTIQKEFEKKGFLLDVKPSDRNTFAEKYKTTTELKKNSAKYLEKFGLEYNKLSDFIIDKKKLLQVILAFAEDAQQAFQKKSKLLVPDSRQYDAVTEFIKNTDVVTNDTLLNLYLLYAACEEKKKCDTDPSRKGKIPISFYVIDSFARQECANNPAEIDKQLQTPDQIANLIQLYTAATVAYYNEMQENGIDYNTMIKQPVDYKLLEKSRNTAKALISGFF